MKRSSPRRVAALALILLFAVGLKPGGSAAAHRGDNGGQEADASDAHGATRTALSDGRVLIVGGETAESSARIWNERTRTTTRPRGRIQTARAWHTATVLADGTVLLLGGRDGNRLVDVAEAFDPVTETFRPIPLIGARPRASHAGTLLTDGRVLVTGGSDGGPGALPTEVLDIDAGIAETLGGASIDRAGHRAALMADGRVLVEGGRRTPEDSSPDAEAIDPVAGTVRPAQADRNEAPPFLTQSSPRHGATGVAIDARLALRFSGDVAAASLTPAGVTLSGPDGPVRLRIVAAENGRLVFVWPLEPLAHAASYVLRVSDAVDLASRPVAPASISFLTAPREESVDPQDNADVWVPDLADPENGGRTNRPRSPWELLDPLVAASGVTAISGRVLTVDGRPLRGVTLAMGGASIETDQTGRFLLTPSAAAGRHVLAIDGGTASRPNRRYGFFEYGMTVVPHQTNVLPFTIWMPRLDTRHVVRIPSPTTSEVVLTTPYIPGLELHIPPHIVIRGKDGRPVTELGITPIPTDRAPFPLNVDVPIYFTIQPGGGYVHTSGYGSRGAWLVYPNYRNEGIPGQVGQFFHYDPKEKDWYVYGTGTVTPNARQVMPSPSTRLYELTGAMFYFGDSPPPLGATPGGPLEADPVDPSTGLFVMQKTDLTLPDVVPLVLTRTYNSGDTVVRAFGRGMVHPYRMFLWSALQYQECDLFLPDGGKIHYVRTSPGTGFLGAVFEHTATPTRFYKSTAAWNGSGWNLRLTDGTVYVFGDEAPLQKIVDRHGNETALTWSATNVFGAGVGNLLRVRSPNHRWIDFTYDTSNRVTQATDNIGRTVTYTYDANGNLSTVTDPENHVTTYTYDAANRMVSIEDGRDIVFVTNQYTNGRVTQQTLADPAHTYTFAYTVNGSGKVTQTDVTNPRGFVERLTFNANGQVVTRVEALGTAVERTTTMERQAGTNLVTAVIDGLNRRTEFTYNTRGQVLTETRLAGTANAVTTTYTYEPTFGQLTSATDPLSHTWSTAYDTGGKPVSTTDPLAHQTLFGTNPAGQVTSVTSALGHTWQYGYLGADLTSTTDPLGHTARRFVDTGGRVLTTTDPLGRVTSQAYDNLNRVTSITDAHGGQTAFIYDANSNFLSLTDARSHTTSYTHDTSDRVATRTDPLTRAESYTYDGNDNLVQHTDRKSQFMSRTYDALDRLTLVTYHDTSTTAYTYDAGDRLAQVVDSLAGTITRTYDGFDRPTSETTPEGSITYTYHADGRRATMTVAGQATVSYGYDAAHRLTSITQGTAVVSFTYDDADRRSTLTYPNGIVATYGYDAAGQLTSLTYARGATTLGTLTYTYDAAGNRTAVGGTWARTGLPAPLASATYDAANQIATWAGTAFTYDANGNLTNDGAKTYAWNARDELVALTGAVSASFAYDGIGRRRSKAITGTTTRFLFDGWNIAQELGGGGTPTANILVGLGLDEAFTRADGSGVSTLLTDALGSTLALTNGSGALQAEYTYQPFGATTVSGATNANAQQFTGRENDQTALYAYRARFYSPALQRFVSEDPLELRAGDSNLYAYVFNAPVDFIDPLGEIVLPWRQPPWCDPESPGARKFVLPFKPILDLAFGDICEPNLAFPSPLAMAKGPKPFPKGKPTPKWKPTDALRDHNKMARDAARAAGLDRNQMRILHREIHGQNFDYHQIVQIAKGIKGGS